MRQKNISIVAQFAFLEANLLLAQSRLSIPYPCTCLMRNDDRNVFLLFSCILFVMQVGSISQNWDGVLKTIVAKADRFSIDFPPNIGKK
jgi:hypothetical protein